MYIHGVPLEIELRLDSWVGKIPWRKNGNPLQYSCLGNPMDRGAWRAAVLGVAKSQTGLSESATTGCSAVTGSSPSLSGFRQWRVIFLLTFKPMVDCSETVPHHCFHDRTLVTECPPPGMSLIAAAKGEESTVKPAQALEALLTCKWTHFCSFYWPTGQEHMLL